MIFYPEVENKSQNWQCDQCTLLNNISNSNCDACGERRPNILQQPPINTTPPNLSVVDDLSPRDNFINYSESFECPHLSCNSSFISFDDFYRHMESHQAKASIDKSRDNYQAQYSDYLTKLVERGKITASQATKEFKYMEKSLAKEDTMTKTKGIGPLIKSNFKSKYSKTSRFLMSKSVDFYFSSLGDAGWGCGYRNIQMICSYLFQFGNFKKILFGDRNYIPSLVVIQGWIEKCWKNGFDEEGAKHFSHTLVNTRGKIGTNEAAALFRSFGIKMNVIDFISKRLSEDMIRAQEIVLKGTNEVPQEYEIHTTMINWIVKYFTVLSNSKFCPPLYLQHDGHSRTIVGIAEDKNTDEVMIILFDPAHSGNQLKSSLQNKQGMHHVLKRPQDFMYEKYQIGYITANEIFTGEKLEQLKKMDFLAESNDYLF